MSEQDPNTTQPWHAKFGLGDLPEPPADTPPARFTAPCRISATTSIDPTGETRCRSRQPEAKAKAHLPYLLGIRPIQCRQILLDEQDKVQWQPVLHGLPEEALKKTDGRQARNQQNYPHNFKSPENLLALACINQSGRHSNVYYCPPPFLRSLSTGYPCSGCRCPHVAFRHQRRQAG